MEVSNQYSSASARTSAPDTPADRISAENAQPAQPKVFPEAGVPVRFATNQDDRLPTQKPGPIVKTPSYDRTGSPHPNDALVSKEHDGAADACAKSAFRECRGGEALEARSSSYVQFDQFDHKETAGSSGRGTCEGIVRETLRRMDRNYRGQSGSLRSTVINMRTEMSSGRADRTNIYGRIQAFQNRPSALTLKNYRQSSDADLNPKGKTLHGEAVEGLMDSLSLLRRGGLAYIGMGIRGADATGPATSGHELLLQHLPADGSADPQDRYTIFDPNNGAFTYDSFDKMQSSLRDYMESADSEDRNVATPNTIQFFTPPSSRSWGSLPPTTSLPGRVDSNTLEPVELMHHRYIGSDRSQAKTDNLEDNETSARKKRGGVLGSCGKSQFRECRGGEALLGPASSYVSFDQNDRRETRGDNGRGTCEGIVREAMRRIDRSYSVRAAIDLSRTVITMQNDMRTSRTARESGIYDNIDTYQHNRNALALRVYGQSRDLNFNANGPSSREDRLNSLMDNLNAMPPGGLAFVGVNIQTGDTDRPGDNAHVILIQRRHDVAAPDGSPPAHQYIIFDPNNGAFDYDTPNAMNVALRNYMHTAYREIDSSVTPDRALFYNPRRMERDRPTLLPATIVPPSLQLPEPPLLMLPFPSDNFGTGDSGHSHTGLKRSPPSENSGH